jgi:GDPmannose 4,6-dehydratase
MSEKALITGVTGQDGSYMADLLLEKGYDVYGMVRHSASPDHSRIEHVKNRMTILEGDLTDDESINRIFSNHKFDEVYNFAAHSYVGNSWEMPLHVMNTNMLGVCRILNAVQRFNPEARVYQASTSEMFGEVQEVPQKETTSFHPRSPYGVAKVGAYWASVNYRESYGLFVSNGILFNHESPRRGSEFVTQKIIREVCRIEDQCDGMEGIPVDPLVLGNLNSKRDWGHARDYVRAAWLMLQQGEPDDYVIATGQSHSVREFVEKAFEGRIKRWEGYGVNEVGLDCFDNVLVRCSEEFFRPAEVEYLLGYPLKARLKLGWEPQYDLDGLVKDMKRAEKNRRGR